MGSIFVLSFWAAANPTLLAVVTLIVTRPQPKPLLLAFLVGAVLISLSCGLLLVFVLAGTQTANNAKHTISPVIDIALGALILGAALWVQSGRDRRLRAWREQRRQKTRDKPPPRWKRTVNNASPWSAFVLGIVLTLPGADYIAGMDILSKRHLGIAAVVAVVIAFNVIQLLIIELPTVGYIVKPQTADAAVERFNHWIRRRGQQIVLVAAIAIGVALVALGVASL